MRSIGRGLVAAVALLAMGGCATFLHGSRQAIPVQSFPTGATVTTYPGKAQSTTPTILSLARKKNYVLSVSEPGYSTASITIQKHISNGYVVADVLASVLALGVIVDGLTGAWYDLSPDLAVVTLTKVGDVPGPASITVHIDGVENGGGLRITSDGPNVTVNVTNRR